MDEGSTINPTTISQLTQQTNETKEQSLQEDRGVIPGKCERVCRNAFGDLNEKAKYTKMV